jgi:serine/threonine-protein kinase
VSHPSQPDALDTLPPGASGKAASPPDAAVETTSGEQPAVIGGRFELLGLLGTGGMGSVYKARDRELGELVALKMLHPELANSPARLERFRQEVRLARRVTHPAVARTYDIGEHGPARFLTMEFIEGEALSGRLGREGRLSVSRTLELARPICSGLAAAHAVGVVHRDLKPDNVLISRTGRVVITDFGVAREVAGVHSTGAPIGTPAYMAPEQIDGGAIDARTDLYALGVMLYQMVTGELPWEGQQVLVVLMARLLRPPPDPRSRRPDLDARMADLILRCLSRHPDGRPASADEVARELEPLAGLASAATGPTTPPPPVRPVTAGEKRVAVLPFANHGPPDRAYVADGLTDDLMVALGTARGLRVRSPGAVVQKVGPDFDVIAIGRQLAVEVVVEGSVRPTPGGFRINARLISVADGFQLWARRFDVPEAELLAQNDAIATAIAAALTVDVALPERAVVGAQAVDLYLRARHAHQRSFTGDRAEAMRLFDEALALTPDDPRALAGRAMAGAYHWSWSPASRQAAILAAERAVALAPMMAEAHAARGFVQVMDGDVAAAVWALKQALRLSPGNLEANAAMGLSLVEADRPEGLSYLEAAIAIDPSIELAYAYLVAFHTLRGDPELAASWIARAAAQNPVLGLLMESRMVFWRRDVARARELLTRDSPGLPEALEKGVPGVRERALVWLELLASDGARRAPGRAPAVPPGHALIPRRQWFFDEVVVETACFAGDLVTALAALQRLDRAGHMNLLWLERLPVLEPLRALPEAAPLRQSLAARAAQVVRAYQTTLP